MKRFWIYHHGSPVKLTLRDDPIEVYECGEHEEGYSFSHAVYFLEGNQVICQATDGGADCDGLYKEEVTLRWDGKTLRTNPDGYRMPSWQRGRVTVTDTYAQMMGY